MALIFGSLAVKATDTAGTFGRGLRAWWAARHKRRAVASLAVLAPGQLDDVGLSPEMIDAALKANAPAKALARAYSEAAAAKAAERQALQRRHQSVVFQYHPANVLKTLWF